VVLIVLPPLNIRRPIVLHLGIMATRFSDVKKHVFGGKAKRARPLRILSQAITEIGHRHCLSGEPSG
jgi:hypothetical protein